MSDISASAASAASSALGGATALQNGVGTTPGQGGISDAKKLHEVAQQFEAIFVRQMLAEARKSNMGDELFGNQGTDTFREMQEQTFASLTTKSGGLGFAKMIEKQLANQLHIGTPAATPANTARKD